MRPATILSVIGRPVRSAIWYTSSATNDQSARHPSRMTAG